MSLSTPKAFSLSNSIDLTKSVRLSDANVLLSKKKVSSKVSLLISKSLMKKSKTELCLADHYSVEEGYSTLNSSLSSNSIYINVIIYYSLDNWKSSVKHEIMINENYTVSSLISCVVDNINYEFSKLKNESNKRINNNSDNYEIRFANKNGMPKYDYPNLNGNSRVKDYSKLKFCLVWKSNNDNNDFIVFPNTKPGKLIDSYHNPETSFDSSNKNSSKKNKCLIF